MPRPPDAKASRRSLILRTIYALCLLGATYNHWFAMYHHGLHWDYGGKSDDAQARIIRCYAAALPDRSH